MLSISHRSLTVRGGGVRNPISTLKEACGRGSTQLASTAARIASFHLASWVVAKVAGRLTISRIANGSVTAPILADDAWLGRTTTPAGQGAPARPRLLARAGAVVSGERSSRLVQESRLRSPPGAQVPQGTLDAVGAFHRAGHDEDLGAAPSDRSASAPWPANSANSVVAARLKVKMTRGCADGCESGLEQFASVASSPARSPSARAVGRLTASVTPMP
jgi:hypothetical protein